MLKLIKFIFLFFLIATPVYASIDIVANISDLDPDASINHQNLVYFDVKSIDSGADVNSAPYVSMLTKLTRVNPDADTATYTISGANRQTLGVVFGYDDTAYWRIKYTDDAANSLSTSGSFVMTSQPPSTTIFMNNTTIGDRNNWVENNSSYFNILSIGGLNGEVYSTGGSFSGQSGNRPGAISVYDLTITGAFSVTFDYKAVTDTTGGGSIDMEFGWGEAKDATLINGADKPIHWIQLNAIPGNSKYGKFLSGERLSMAGQPGQNPADPDSDSISNSFGSLLSSVDKGTININVGNLGEPWTVTIGGSVVATGTTLTNTHKIWWGSYNDSVWLDQLVYDSSGQPGGVGTGGGGVQQNLFTGKSSFTRENASERATFTRSNNSDRITFYDTP